MSAFGLLKPMIWPLPISWKLVIHEEYRPNRPNVRLYWIK